MNAINQDHVTAASAVALVETSMPSVLAYFQGAAAPVASETNLIIAAGAIIYWIASRLMTKSNQHPVLNPEVPNA